ncbi:MAG: trigger factor [Syntrophus sp. RIFOXYC2_FULL_54_9]|nr:MAG: trigger factor [Syntrophus sp. GWC2_56_31]OHE31806.1 MAG: trigger factor [Syntrophus sp. RIFOXYC2_FULL_54_9]
MSEISAAIKIEDISSVKKKLSFDIPWADVKNELDTVYRKVGRTAKVKGFRPGKIPRAILEMYYREQAEKETVAGIVNGVYWRTLQEKEIPAVTQPQIEQKGIERDKDFSFSAIVEVEPAIDPKDYLGLELEKEDPAVTEEDLEKRLQDIRQMFSTMEDLNEDRGVIEGDFVTLNFTGKISGETLKELTAENHLLEIGSKTFVPGFEEQLLGMRKGEARSFVITFPETDVPAHLAGKDVEFAVNIGGIRVKRAPEIDDNFIKNFEKYESLDALKADVRKNLEEEKKAKVAADLDKSIGDKLLASNEFEAPDSFIENQIHHMLLNMRQRMVSGGMDPKKATEVALKFRDQCREEATKIVKTVILIKNIARKEALAVDEMEVEKQIAEMASQRAQDFETFKKSLEKEDLMDSIKSEILSRKTYEFLLEKAHITTVGAKKAEIAEETK